MGILDSLLAAIQGGGSGLFSDAMAQQPQQQAPQPQGPPPVGMFDRLGAGVQSFIGSQNPIEGLVNGVGALASGKRTDPGGIQQDAVRSMINHLVGTRQITPVQAQFLAANPGAWGELSKAMINQQPTVGPDGSMVVMGPFGQPRHVGNFPVSERIDVTNPDGSKGPAFAIKPNLASPSGSIVVPGAPGSPVAAPRGASGQPALNPNMPNGGRGIITAQSPGQIEEQQGVAKALAEDYGLIAKGARTAAQTKNVLSVMERLSPDAFSGKAAPLQQYMTSLASSFGIAPQKLLNKASASELFTSLSNELTLAASGGSLGAQISNSDRDFMQSRFPELSQTPGGRLAIISYLKQLADRQVQVQSLADEYSAPNGPGRGSMRGFNAYLEKWKELPENSIFKDAFSDRFVGINTTPPAGPGDPGVTVTSVRRRAQP